MNASRQRQEQHDKSHLFRLLAIICMKYLYRFFVQIPVSTIKAWSRHPVSLLILFLILIPIYVLTQCCVFLSRCIAKLLVIPREIRLLFIINKLFTNNEKEQQRHSLIDLNGGGDDDDLNKYLERCSICFESKLDMCLEYCRDQFCLGCFQRYVTDVVQSSWGLSVTKVRCPVCRVHVPQSEWAKYVPASTTELYNKFNQPFQSFSRCCSHCQADMAPCDSKRLVNSQSKVIAAMIQEFFNTTANCDKTDQQGYFIRLFENIEWRNSTITDIHHRLIQHLLRTCPVVDQSQKVKAISLEILQLELRPDTWRKLQFDHISIFPDMSCPACHKEMCLQCGQDSHPHAPTCEENMKQLISQNVLDHDVETLKWKLDNSRKCPSCSIMIHRDEGCNKVDCTLCGFSFCWECRSTWSESCSYFVCTTTTAATATATTKPTTIKPSISVVKDLYIANREGEGSSISRAELGVPDVQIIHARRSSSS